jgi:hypothetical protein
MQGHELNSPLLENFGETMGLALGVIVTEALAFSKEVERAGESYRLEVRVADGLLGAK